MKLLHLLLKLIIDRLLVCNFAEQLVVFKFFSESTRRHDVSSDLFLLIDDAHDLRLSLLLDLLLGLLFVIFQVHQRFLGKFQVPFKLPLDSLQVHADLLFLFQRTLKLNMESQSINFSETPLFCRIIVYTHSRHPLAVPASTWLWSAS